MTSSSALARRGTAAVVAGSCVAAVVVWGPLSTGALLVVGATGTAVAVMALLRRSGSGSTTVGRRGLPWWGWATAACAWELGALMDDDLPTVSDLADPLLAHPVLRGVATVCWLGVGAWLLTPPRDRPQPAEAARR
jgi:hypothetical protein